jgi:hypothetical protein
VLAMVALWYKVDNKARRKGTHEGQERATGYVDIMSARVYIANLDPAMLTNVDDSEAMSRRARRSG